MKIEHEIHRVIRVTIVAEEYSDWAAARLQAPNLLTMQNIIAPFLLALLTVYSKV